MLARTWKVAHDRADEPDGAQPCHPHFRSVAAHDRGGLVTVISPPEWMQEAERGSVGDYAGAFLFWFLVLAAPVLLGGLIHELAIRAIPASWSPTKQRLVILAPAAVVPLSFLLVGNSPNRFANLKLVIPVLIGMVFYGLLAKPVPE
jgi:hypothetical protein